MSSVPGRRQGHHRKRQVQLHICIRLAKIGRGQRHEELNCILTQNELLYDHKRYHV
jgi:hypothetical protein